MEDYRVVKRTRRLNGEGSVYQLKNGRWVGAASLGKDENGKLKRKLVYGRTRMEAADKLTKITKRIASDNFNVVNNSTLEVLMKDWLLVFKKTLVTPRSFEFNLMNFNLHIAPVIGKMKIDEITPYHVQKLLNDMLSQGYSLSTVKKIKFLLGQFYEFAIDNNYVTTNPVMKTKVRSAERKIYDGENRYKALPPAIRQKFIESLNHHDFFKPFCMCMMFAGLRIGEALGLTWENIDFKNNIIKIEKAVTVVPRFDYDGKVVERVTVVSATKTACSVREVPMPDILVDAMHEHKTKQELVGDSKGKNLIASDAYVFGTSEGHVRTYGGVKKMFREFLEKHGLNKCGIHFHGLRHTYSNMLFEENVNPKVIQALLGHKSVNTTITTYNSVDKSYFKQATETINKHFNQQKERELTPQEKFDNLSDDDYEYLLEMLKERRKKKEKDFEM